MIPGSVFNRAIMPETRVIQEYRALEARVLDAMTRALTNVEFSEIALEVFAFQCRWNAAYRAFAANVPAPQSWQEIPAVPQAAFKRSKMSCVPVEAVQTVFRTSGTTGETRGEHLFLDTHLYNAAIVRGWDWLGVERLPIRVIAHRPEDAPNSSLSHMFGVIARERANGETQWFVARDGSLDAARFQRSVEKDGPVGVLGTALGFLNLFERLGERRIALPRGSFVMETGGYKGSGRELAKRDLYKMFDQFLGVPEGSIINEYGMTELSSQFYARGLDRPHLPPPWLKAQVINPETGREAAAGETGILRIFDLANLNSTLAIESQDLAIRREDGFELLGRDPRALPRGCSRAADELMRR
jgi:acyl-coenzyme A synthetase/AMP-(fatty) acid ligase